jgi:hypothetical protein
MPDETQDQNGESPAARFLREKREQEAANTDLAGNERDEQKEASERQLTGAGSEEPLGRVLGDEENPSDSLKLDGSRSPHDASSEGGSRQGAAHKQVQEAEQASAAADAKRRGAGAPNAVNVAPSPEQAKSGEVAGEK